ncbi:MAG: hypothetical protein P8X64_08580 [Anaerolineales bacterium]|jgi:hypothetical protein
MNITGRDIAVQEAYRNELQRQARMWHSLHRSPRRVTGLQLTFREIMIQIGVWLESAGCRIRTRYALPKPEAPRSSIAGSGLSNC